MTEDTICRELVKSNRILKEEVTAAIVALDECARQFEKLESTDMQVYAKVSSERLAAIRDHINSPPLAAD